MNKEIHREKDLSEKILEHCENGVAGFNQDFQVTLWNPPMERMTGVMKNQALQKSLFAVIPLVQTLNEKKPILRGRGGTGVFSTAPSP